MKEEVVNKVWNIDKKKKGLFPIETIMHMYTHSGQSSL
jgi:hypothetical protein